MYLRAGATVLENSASQRGIFVRLLGIRSFRLGHPLPMRQPTINEGPRFLVSMLVQPPYVLGLLPSMEFVRQWDRGSHEDVMQYDERR